MTVYTAILIDIESGQVLGHDHYQYSGELIECKRKKEKQLSEEQLKGQSALQKEAFKLQKENLAKINAALDKYLSGDVGFTPEQESLLVSSFLNELGASKDVAGQQVRTALLRRGTGGGDQPVGGDFTRGIAGLEGQFGTARAGGLRDIRLANIQQALENKFRSAGVISGNAQILSSPISTFGAGGANALNQRILAGTAPGLGTAFLGGLGQGLGAGITGGVGGALSGLFKTTPKSS